MENIGTIIVAAILIIIVGLVIFKIIKDRKAGKSSCGCNCTNCKGNCH